MCEPDHYCVTITEIPEAQGIHSIAGRVFLLVFRTTLDASGFALLRFDAPISSTDLRRFMVSLKRQLGQLYFQERGRHLVYRSMLRFDQQATTRFHLDGAPEESYLMLGYEPSEVKSEVAIADYTRAAWDRGRAPEQFLAEFANTPDRLEQALEGCITRVEEFDAACSQVLLVNNSRLPIHPRNQNSLGVMHQATIFKPLPGKQRIINSTLLVTASDPSEELVTAEEQEAYINTAEFHG